MKLKRCPFCGSKAEIVEVGNEYFPKCKGSIKHYCLLSGYPVPGRDGFNYKKDAIEVWNKRIIKDK